MHERSCSHVTRLMLYPAFALVWCHVEILSVNLAEHRKWVKNLSCLEWCWSVAYPGILFRVGFNKFSWGQREQGSGDGSPL